MAIYNGIKKVVASIGGNSKAWIQETSFMIGSCVLQRLLPGGAHKWQRELRSL
jgi:hypothetical protein